LQSQININPEQEIINDFAVIIAIVDSAAQLVLLQRMDHAQFGSIQVAIKKAENAVQFKRPNKIFEDALSQSGLALRLLTITGVCAVDGGIPLLRDGKIVSAVGAAGMLPHQDAHVAQAGADAFHHESRGQTTAYTQIGWALAFFRNRMCTCN
jgi:glc operon protein GlcG